MSLDYNKKLIPFAKYLRENMTNQEKHLWYDFLKGYSPRFQRQKTIGNFIADFYCHKAKLIIELDGSQHFTLQGLEHDKIRTEILECYDLEVLRFTNREIDDEFESVCKMIDCKVKKKL